MRVQIVSGSMCVSSPRVPNHLLLFFGRKNCVALRGYHLFLSPGGHEQRMRRSSSIHPLSCCPPHCVCRLPTSSCIHDNRSSCPDCPFFLYPSIHPQSPLRVGTVRTFILIHCSSSSLSPSGLPLLLLPEVLSNASLLPINSLTVFSHQIQSISIPSEGERLCIQFLQL